MMIAASSPFVTSLEHIVGFAVVLFALTLLWGITAFVGRIFMRLEPRTALAPASSANSGDPSEEEVVAITAVVAALMGRRSRIVSIRSGGAKDWNREGRREHFASHRIR